MIVLFLQCSHFIDNLFFLMYKCTACFFVELNARVFVPISYNMFDCVSFFTHYLHTLNDCDIVYFVSNACSLPCIFFHFINYYVFMSKPPPDWAKGGCWILCPNWRQRELVRSERVNGLAQPNLT